MTLYRLRRRTTLSKESTPYRGAVAKKLQELGIEIASIHLIGSLKQHVQKNKFLKDYLR